MRRISMVLLSLALGAQCSIAASSANGDPLKLKHMDYSKARKLILSNGWTPLGGPCEQISKDTCLHWPEIGSCTGVSPDLCGMVFKQNSQCLYVSTRGDEPDGSNAGSMRIESVTYQPGPCAKN
jgi:hypothetical protein